MTFDILNVNEKVYFYIRDMNSDWLCGKTDKDLWKIGSCTKWYLLGINNLIFMFISVAKYGNNPT